MRHEQVDKVFTNATFEVLDLESRRVNALAVADGKVVAHGEQALELAGVAGEVVDLEGRYVIPGVIDVHNHHVLAGQMDLFELNASPRMSFAELLSEVEEYSRTLEPEQWLVGGSWGSGLQPDINSVESLAKLDEASNGHPVLLKDDSKHNRWANSRAMALAGIDDNTEDPEGGEILRDEYGRATGVLIESAGVIVEKALQLLHPTPAEDYERSVERGIEILHSFGITGFQDAATSLQVMDALKQLDDSGKLHSWVVSSMQANDFIFGTSPLGEGIIEHRERTRSNRHRPDFIKIFLDGVPPAGTAAFIEPYLDGVGFPACHCGGTTMPAEELEHWLMTTAERGISAKIHCTGDASVRLVLDTVEKVREAGYSDVRYHIAHGQFINPDDVPRFSELGVVADISPALWFPGVISEAIASVLGSERGSRMHPNRDLLDSGAVVAAGSDWPVSESPNPWEGIYGLVTRKDPTKQVPGELWPEQAVSLAEALRIYTVYPAEAMGLGGLTGNLDLGKSADFVVLDDDIFSIDIDEIPGISASETWFAGERVFDRGTRE